MRRVIAPLLLALAIVSPLLAQSAATSAPTTRYSRLYVFGDSYSDIGAGYIDGNGPTAANCGIFVGSSARVKCRPPSSRRIWMCCRRLASVVEVS